MTQINRPDHGALFMCAFALLLALLSGSVVAVDMQGSYKLPPPSVAEENTIPGREIDVLGVRMFYLEYGDGDPIVFLHGNPTSSYLWRNVIPHVGESGRAIAPDLVGMGRSGKPDSDYRFADHYRYLDEFIRRLNLDDITFVVHDWGAALGFEFARRNPGRVKGIAFMEGVLPPIFPQPGFAAMGDELGDLFRAFKDPKEGRELVIEQNMFIEQLLPGFANRQLGEQALKVYRAPFESIEYREPLLAWPREIPIAGEPADIVAMMIEVEKFMTTTDIPMLLLYADPGVLVPPEVADWYTTNLKSIESVYIGQGLHFVQEDQPFAIGRAIADWMRRIQ